DLSGLAGPILAPGLGAQGASPGDLRAVFGGRLDTVLPSVSRSVLAAGPGPSDLRAAFGRALDEIRAVWEATAGR
ncbi:MAG TPA: hypothetical protein VFX70_06795, partial [Mycobacteriales bacterium]|nr:hypothetical protein [Mycobacteriales bacterium]